MKLYGISICISVIIQLLNINEGAAESRRSNFNSSKGPSCTVEGEIIGYKDPSIIILHLHRNVFILSGDSDETILKERTKDGRFKFDNIPLEGNSYITIEILNHDRIINNSIDLFLIGPSDSINLLFSGDSVSISGKGSEKLICQQAINKVLPAVMPENEAQILHKKMGYEYLRREFSLIDSFYARKIQVLESFKKTISSESYNQILVNIEAEGNFQKHYEASLLFIVKAERNVLKERVNYYRENLLKLKSDTFKAKDKVSSTYFTDYLLLKCMSDLLVMGYKDNDSIIASRAGFVDKFNYINKLDVPQEVKQKVITGYLKKYYGGKMNERKIMDSAIKTTTAPDLLAILNRINQTRNSGVEAFRFALPNLNGKIVRLTDFKGKVTVIDFWFTGCSSCAALEKQMKLVRSYFKDKGSVQFISVGVDKSRSLWKSSVKSGVYTEKEAVNLFTDGLGEEHPFIKYYGIKGFPEIFIIDKNLRMYSAKPDRPYDEKSVKTFVKLVEQVSEMQ